MELQAKAKNRFCLMLRKVARASLRARMMLIRSRPFSCYLGLTTGPKFCDYLCSAMNLWNCGRTASSGTSQVRSAKANGPRKPPLQVHPNHRLFTSWLSSLPFRGCNTTILAHCDADKGGLQSLRLGSGIKKADIQVFLEAPLCGAFHFNYCADARRQ